MDILREGRRGGDSNANRQVPPAGSRFRPTFLTPPLKHEQAWQVIGVQARRRRRVERIQSSRQWSYILLFTATVTVQSQRSGLYLYRGHHRASD